MTMLLKAIVTASALAFASGAHAQSPPPPPLVKTESVRQVSTHVHVIPDESAPLVPNVGIIVGDTGVLVVDTGLGARNGAAIAAVAQKLGGSRALYLVTTHFHPEHDLGAHGFPSSTKMIRADVQEQDIAEYGLELAGMFAKRSEATAALLKDATFRKADITFKDSYDLDLGGLKVRLIAPGPNHTRGDTAIWVEADRVLFSGDIAMKGMPAFASPRSSLKAWLASLDKLEALQPMIVVPSHGPIGDTGFMTGYRAYLTEVRDRTAAEKLAGRSLESTSRAVTDAMSARYPDVGRLSGAIAGAYREAP